MYIAVNKEKLNYVNTVLICLFEICYTDCVSSDQDYIYTVFIFRQYVIDDHFVHTDHSFIICCVHTGCFLICICVIASYYSINEKCYISNSVYL